MTRVSTSGGALAGAPAAPSSSCTPRGCICGGRRGRRGCSAFEHAAQQARRAGDEGRIAAPGRGARAPGMHGGRAEQRRRGPPAHLAAHAGGERGEVQDHARQHQRLQLVPRLHGGGAAGTGAGAAVRHRLQPQVVQVLLRLHRLHQPAGRWCEDHRYQSAGDGRGLTQRVERGGLHTARPARPPPARRWGGAGERVRQYSAPIPCAGRQP